MKYANAFKWLSVILVIAVMIPAIGCGKKESSGAHANTYASDNTNTDHPPGRGK